MPSRLMDIANGLAVGRAPGRRTTRRNTIDIDGLSGSPKDYQSVPQDENGNLVRVRWRAVGLQGACPALQFLVTLVPTTEFAIVVSTCILLNTVVIGLECQDVDNAHGPLWYWLESVFVCAYFVEILLRFAHYGCLGFFASEDALDRGWNNFDFCTTIFGVVGLMLDVLAMDHVRFNTSVLRLLRLLRIVRVLRLCRFLKDAEYTLIQAMTSMGRMMFLVFLIDFIGAVIITHILHETEDEVVFEMFGKLSDSMYYLFTIMVDGMGAVHITSTPRPGILVVITEKVVDAHPEMRFFWIVYALVGTISLIALAPAIFIDLNMRDAQIAQQKHKQECWERRVDAQKELLETIFKAADSDCSNSLSREEIDVFLQRRDVMNLMNPLREESDIFQDDPSMDQGSTDHDLRHLRLEFQMVYDHMEEQGKKDLSCKEFIDAFRKMRKKPVDQVVLALQEEILKLRNHIIEESNRFEIEIWTLLAEFGITREVDMAKADSGVNRLSVRPARPCLALSRATLSRGRRRTSRTGTTDISAGALDSWEQSRSDLTNASSTSQSPTNGIS